MSETGSLPSSNLRSVTEEENLELKEAISRSAGGVRTMLVPTPTIVKQEWHEKVADYLVLGLDHTSISRMVNCSPKQIGKLLAQGWFQEMLSDRMEKGGISPFVLFKGAMVTAFGALVEICADPKAQGAARVAAAKELLNRFMPMAQGVPPDQLPKPITDPVAEYDKLSARLAGIRSLTGEGRTPSTGDDKQD